MCLMKGIVSERDLSEASQASGGGGPAQCQMRKNASAVFPAAVNGVGPYIGITQRQRPIYRPAHERYRAWQQVESRHPKYHCAKLNCFVDNAINREVVR